MRQFIFRLLWACLACAGVSAAGAAEYFNIEMRMDVNGKSMSHQAIAEPGKKVRVISKEDGQPVMRADYTLGPVGADEGGERIGRVSGMVFAPGADGALSLASEWVVLAKMGKPFHFESRNERFNTVIDMVISPMTKEQVEEKIGGKIPESSSCDTASDWTRHDLLKSNEDNCCEKQCGSGTKGIRCCGGIGCCDFRQEENC